MANAAGLKIIFNRLPEIIHQHPVIAGMVVARTAHGIEADMKRRLSGSGGGRVYIREGVAHQASLPGEAPARDTGTLVNSIRARQVSLLHWRVEIGAEYGLDLELGTRHMAPRPFAAPAAEAHRAEFLAAMAAALRSRG